VTGFDGFQGPQGDDGVTGFQGIQGTQGIQGPTGEPENVDGINVGGGSEVFQMKVGGDLQFRTLVEGTNITLTQNSTTIDIAVSDIFNWDNTVFIGSNGAVVDAGSSLTFSAGACLFTNKIDETSFEAGVTIGGETGGVLVKDGGVKFDNNLDSLATSGPTDLTRLTTLSYFEFGCFSTTWTYGAANSSTVDVVFQRIGNTVTLFIPDLGSIINDSGGSTNLTTAAGTLPERLRPSQTSKMLMTFEFRDSGLFI